MSIRSVERITGIHRDTIMRLGARVGRGCAELHDRMMVGLRVGRIETDELRGFVGKFGKLDPSVSMVEPAEDRIRDNISEPLDRARAGRILPIEFALHYNRRRISQEFVEGGSALTTRGPPGTPS
jgi:hypothetical protein